MKFLRHLLALHSAPHRPITGQSPANHISFETQLQLKSRVLYSAKGLIDVGAYFRARVFHYLVIDERQLPNPLPFTLYKKLRKEKHNRQKSYGYLYLTSYVAVQNLSHEIVREIILNVNILSNFTPKLQ
jgi:hypothetical protein